jgi:DnaJ domain
MPGMARPWSRKGKEPAEPPAGEDEPAVALDSDEHAWWSQREVTGAWSRHHHATPTETEPERDILAEHFGADWRTSFGFTPAPEPPAIDEPADEGPPIDTSDPYAVLEVSPDAPWEDIVAAHRRQARRHHPDRLAGEPPAVIAVAEDRIRDINAAYQELRVRRGR